MSEPVRYSVDLAARHAHLYAVTAEFPLGEGGAAVADGAVDLRLPAWTPGSYLLREFARQLQDVECTDAAGRALPTTKVDKATWRVHVGAATRLCVRYRVFAHELTVRTAHLDDTHGFWNGACLFLYIETLRDRAALVRVARPDGWRVTTALPDEDGVFRAASYDQLVDSPFEVGTHELIEFTAAERPHRIAIWGRVETPRAQLAADLGRIIDAAAALFREDGAPPVPYDDYTFLLLTAPGQYGGLEHAASSTLLTSPYAFTARKRYEEFLELVAHEYFHLWNVKRIHPAALGPFDYTREAYTRSLWVMEGFTSYYDRHLLVRAGHMSAERYLEKLGEELAKLQQTPGRLRQSLEEASWDAWIKFYRPDENTANSTVSYYLKGGLVALLLDLEIRAASNGARTLDDVLRHLWRRYGKAGVGFPDGAVQGICEEATGTSLGDFFDRHVRGRAELDSERLLATVGLTLRTPERTGAGLGITTRRSGDAAVVASVATGGPAELGGLYAGDELLAFDGLRVTEAGLKERLQARQPGDRVEVTVFRRDELRRATVVLGAPNIDAYEVVPVASPSPAQTEAYRKWMGAELSALV